VTLLVEISPSTVRYARLQDGRATDVVTLSARTTASGPRAWAEVLAAVSPEPVHVYVANSGSAAGAATLAGWLEDAFGTTPRFLPVTTDPSVMPLSRQLALDGARVSNLGPALIVDVDVQVGIDLIGSDGRQLGGWLLPGERRMREVLYAQTSGVAAAALMDRPVVDGVFGMNTAGGVQQGARLGLAAFIAHARAAVVRQFGEVRLVLTGGGAGDIASLVDAPAEWMPTLSLDGFAFRVAEGWT
jgi:Type III pantothenate kinase